MLASMVVLFADYHISYSPCWSSEHSAPQKEGHKKRFGELLSINAARNYVVKLVNADRGKYKLAPVSLDAIGNLAAQLHAEEMARLGYRSHFNSDGKKPCQRYNEAGGLHNVSENLASITGQPISKEQLFSSQELETMEKCFMEEKPPNDSHRSQILRPEHNKIVIGLSYAKSVSGESCLSLVQEFIDAYGVYSKLPKEITGLKFFDLSGSLVPGFTIDRLSIYRENLPTPRKKYELLCETGTYEDGDCFVTEFYRKLEPKIVKTQKQGNCQQFAVRIVPDETWKPGLYYVSIWANSTKFGGPIEVGCQTVLLRGE